MTDKEINKVEKEVKDEVKEVEKEIVPEKAVVEKEVKKEVVKKEISKKEMAFARGVGLRISPKQCIYVCRVIRGKNPGAAVARLEDVINERRAVPMAGLEVGHKKGKGLAGGKFPKNACKAVMALVKQAAANAVVAGIENPVIAIAKSDRAAAPFKKGGRKAKRAHLYIEIRPRQQVTGDRKQGGKK